MLRQFDVVIERHNEGFLLASVPQLPGCHTQAKSLDETVIRIREAIELCLEVDGAPANDLEFVEIHRVTVAFAARVASRVNGPCASQVSSALTLQRQLGQKPVYSSTNGRPFFIAYCSTRYDKSCHRLLRTACPTRPDERRLP